MTRDHAKELRDMLPAKNVQHVTVKTVDLRAVLDENERLRAADNGEKFCHHGNLSGEAIEQAEREACAKILDEVAKDRLVESCNPALVCERLAAAIRARKP